MYSKEFVEDLDMDVLIGILEGGTQYPITTDLLEFVEEIFTHDPALLPLIVSPIGAPFLTVEVVEWIRAFAERKGDREMWERAASDPHATLASMLTAPPARFMGHQAQGFVWKHSLATGQLWTRDQWQSLLAACEAAGQEPDKAPRTMAELVQKILGH